MDRDLGLVVATTLFYFSTCYFGLQSALETSGVHNIVSFDVSVEVADWCIFIANIILPSLLIIRIYLYGWRRELTYRLCLMYLLKGVVQLVTVVPGPFGVETCRNYSLIDIVWFGNCVDMMFSGHTAFTVLVAPYRWVSVSVVMVLLIVGKQHYISDTLVAIIVALWLEYVIPDRMDPPKTNFMARKPPLNLIL